MERRINKIHGTLIEDNRVPELMKKVEDGSASGVERTTYFVENMIIPEADISKADDIRMIRINFNDFMQQGKEFQQKITEYKTNHVNFQAVVSLQTAAVQEYQLNLDLPLSLIDTIQIDKVVGDGTRGYVPFCCASVTNTRGSALSETQTVYFRFYFTTSGTSLEMELTEAMYAIYSALVPLLFQAGCSLKLELIAYK